MPILAADFSLIWSGFTEVDLDNNITTTSTSITWVNMDCTDGSYAYADYGTGNFTTSWLIDGKINVASTSDAGAYTVPIALSSALGDWNSIYGEDNEIWTSAVWSYTYADYWTLQVHYYPDNGSDYLTSTVMDLSFDTDYYFTWYNSEVSETMGIRVYTDADRTNEIYDAYFSCSHNGSYRYIYGAMSRNSNSDADEQDGVLSYVTIYSGVDMPTVETIDSASVSFNGFFNEYDIDVTGNLTDNGGEECVVGFYVAENGTENWSWWSAGFESTGTFETTISTDNSTKIYKYHAFASNSYGTANGTDYYFTTEIVAGEPEVETLAYPFSQSNVGDIWYNAYGEVLSDGTENCTGWIQWRTIGGEWTNTANTTDLRITDLFSGNITGLSLLTNYQYRAALMNTYGTVYGDVGSIYIYAPQTAPTITTLPAGNFTATTADLNVLLNDDGGAPCFVSAQYRKYGTTEWSETTTYYGVTDNETRAWTISGLTPNAQYQYRGHAENYEYEAFGDIVSFQLYAAISLPVVDTVGVYEINSTTIQATGEITHDGGSECEAYFQYREQGQTTWQVTDSEYGLLTGNELDVYLYNMYNGTFDIRFVAENEQGIGYGDIITFQFDSGTVTLPDEPVTDDLLDLVNNVKEALGMTGTFGAWAFMGVIILLLSLIFGIAMVAVPSGIAKAAVGVAWLLSSIATVGAFLFTGQLGMWPFFILAGGVVALVFIVASIKLSGGGNNG